MMLRGILVVVRNPKLFPAVGRVAQPWNDRGKNVPYDKMIDIAINYLDLSYPAMDTYGRLPPNVAHGVRRKAMKAFLVALLLFCLTSPAILHAETISGTVLDPSGAVIAGARIEISGGDLSQPLIFSSDARGKFVSPDLKPGSYLLRVTQQGFEPLVKTVDLRGTAELELKLAIARQREEVTVSGKGRDYANTDPVYRQLRNIGLGETFRFDDFTMHLDAATFHFQKGTLTMLNPVNGIVTGAIFIGEGHFNLKAVTALDGAELKRRSGSPEIDEDFTEAIFRFTGGERLEFLRGGKEKVDTPGDAASLFDHWKEKVRKRREEALGFTEYLLHGETMDNVDADLLAAVYNPSHPPFVNAYIHGRKHKDLRFFVRTRVGAIPQLDSPEEVALLNYDQDAMDDGVWYLAHAQSEYANHQASSAEDRRICDTRLQDRDDHIQERPPFQYGQHLVPAADCR